MAIRACSVRLLPWRRGWGTSPVTLNALEVVDDGNAQACQAVQHGEDDDLRVQLPKEGLQWHQSQPQE